MLPIHRYVLIVIAVLVQVAVGCGASTPLVQPVPSDTSDAAPEPVAVSAPVDEPDGQADVEQQPVPAEDGLPRPVIQAAVRGWSRQLRYCYERALVSDPTLAGTVRVRFVIGPDGSVTEAAVADSTLGKPDVEECVLRAIRQVTFRPPEGGGTVVVTYPFLFRTAEP